jgi:hypothetical protein
MPSDADQLVLETLNARYCVIANAGDGRCKVLDTDTNTLHSFTTLRQRYMHWSVGSKSAGDWWLKHPHRRQFDSLEEARNAGL